VGGDNAAHLPTSLSEDALGVGRDDGPAALSGLAAPARDRVAGGGDAPEPREQAEREYVEDRYPNPTQHVPSVARPLLGAYEAWLVGPRS
jgi:hypothetical protein